MDLILIIEILKSRRPSLPAVRERGTTADWLDRYNTAGFEDGEKGPLAKECGHLLATGKDQKMDSI